MPCVINEWIFHDINGANGLRAQERVGHFLEVFRDRGDRIVVLRHSAWAHKAWQLWKEQDVRVQILSKLLYLGILIDPLKCIYLNPDDVQALPNDLAEQISADDAYLFETALAGNATMIVTTDTRLMNIATNSKRYGIELRFRDDFYADMGLR